MNPDNAGRSSAETCAELLARHADYLDGLLAPHEAARIQWHLGVCRSCARYDRIVRQGLDLVRELPAITPAPDFEQRLQHRLYHIRDAASPGDARPAAGAVATFAVAGLIALVAWSPLLLSTGEPGETTAAAETRPAREALPDVPSLPVRAPLLSGAGDLWEPGTAVSPLSSGEMARILAAFPGPYSPLVVTPPVHSRAVRTISSGYNAQID